MSKKHDVDEDEDVEDVEDDDDDKGGVVVMEIKVEMRPSPRLHLEIMTRRARYSDARQFVNKEKAKQAALKKAQNKAATDAIKQQEKADKEKGKEETGGTRPSGLRKRKPTIGLSFVF